MKLVLRGIAVLLYCRFCGVALCAETKIEVLPPTAYDRATIYLNLAVVWAGIIGLVILLKLKLRELERTQKMEREESEKSAPLLE